MSAVIRKMQEGDIAQVWPLMRDLAVFEHYIDSFAITPEIVKERGFDKQPPDFYCLVADEGGTIGGMLVYYFLNYTAQNRPAVFVKELYVAEDFRNQKLGEKLMNALYAEAKEKGCGQIKWTVSRRVERSGAAVLSAAGRDGRQRMAELCLGSEITRVGWVLTRHFSKFLTVLLCLQPKLRLLPTMTDFKFCKGFGL